MIYYAIGVEKYKRVIKKNYKVIVQISYKYDAD